LFGTVQVTAPDTVIGITKPSVSLARGTIKKKPGGEPGFKACEGYAVSPSFPKLRRCVTGLFASFVFSLALLHQITVLARHWVSLEPLLADFASTGIRIGGG
jgi:hypothetical protein